MIDKRMTDKEKYEEEGYSEWIDLNRSVSQTDKPQPTDIEVKPLDKIKDTPISLEPVKAVVPEKIRESSERIEPEIDWRLERMVAHPKQEKEVHRTPVSTITTIDKKDDIKPWEIDLRGHLLTEKKEPAPYKLWLEEKSKKEGKVLKCLKCGSINRDIAFVVGQKCDDCGFEFEEFENILEKMEEHDEETGIFGTTRLSTGFGEVGTNLKAILAIPKFLRDNPDRTFEFIFKSHSATFHFLLVFAYIVALLFFLPYAFASRYFIVDLIAFILLAMIGISIFTGLAQSTSVTTIKVDDIAVTFSGWSGSTSVNYDEIASISNRRMLNGSVDWMRFTRPVFQTISYVIMLIFFYLFFGWFFYYIYLINYRSGEDPYWDVAVDSSSSSKYYTNNITISTSTRCVNYTFCGAMNLQFVRALAIIIFMAKKKNPKCRIDSASIRAAEKGAEHFSLWRHHYNV